MKNKKTIYTGDKDVIVHLRLNADLYDFIVATASEYNMKNSEFVRFLITIAKKDMESNRADERL